MHSAESEAMAGTAAMHTPRRTRSFTMAVNAPQLSRALPAVSRPVAAITVRGTYTRFTGPENATSPVGKQTLQSPLFSFTGQEMSDDMSGIAWTLAIVLAGSHRKCRALMCPDNSRS